MPSAGQILLAEDDADYAVLLQEAFKEAGVTNPIEVATDGLQVMEYLKGEGDYANRAVHPVPVLIVLDLRLPVHHGFEVLRWIRRHRELRSMFVAILSGSGFQNEAREAYHLGADLFLVKPHDFRRLVEMIEQIRDSALRTEELVGTGLPVAAKAVSE